MNNTVETWKNRNVTPIKGLKVHFTTKEMDELLYKINDILFIFSNLPIIPQSRVYLREKIIETGKELKKLSFTFGDYKIDRKNEILTRLRELYDRVEQSVILGTDEYQIYVAKANSYLTAVYLKDKKEGNLTVEKQLDWIRKIKIFSTVYPVCKNLESVQNELLNNFKIVNNYE